jgi:hypothetical protein
MSAISEELMDKDRVLHILRYVAVPIIVAAITGYYETRVRMASEQTRASYQALAPAVRDLQDQISALRGRIDELSSIRIITTPGQPPAPPVHGHPAAGKPSSGFLGETKVEVEVDAPKPAANAPVKRPAANFDDMLKGL